MNKNDEIVDIVDENGKVLGQVGKKVAHEKGILHPTILAEVINSDGKWLLVKQSGDRQDAGQFVSPVGGHIRSGEEYEDALRREAMEEIGIKDFKYKFIGIGVFQRQVIGRDENHLFILYEIYTDRKITINHESESFMWFSTDELKNEMKINPQKFGDAWWFAVRKFYPKFI